MCWDAAWWWWQEGELKLACKKFLHSAQNCIGTVFCEVVFLYSLRYYHTFQHLSLLIIPKLFSFFRSRKQTKCIWYMIGELSITYTFLGAFSAVRVIIRLRGRCFSCSEYLGPMISPPSQYFLPCQNWNLNISALQSLKAYFAAYSPLLLEQLQIQSTETNKNCQL